MKNIRHTFCFLSVVLIAFCSCRKDQVPIPTEEEIVAPIDSSSLIKGFYLLNEGNMNMNKASLDYFDYSTGTYKRNIYHEINPGITKGLGDVGNDIAIYGSKMYVVVNNSNKVEVLNAANGKFLREIQVKNCRYIIFNEGKAYVSAYLGIVGDPNAPEGNVSEIDTATFAITRQVTVGRQPEEMAVVGNKLYVANSGGYSPENYENTISVIDLPTFTEIQKIPVAINLHRLKKDKYGDLYVTSRGDYYNVPSKLFVIDTKTDQIKKTFNTGVSNFWIDDDTAYIYATEFSYQTEEWVISYKTINVKDEILSEKQFITDGTEKNIKIPYGILVNPHTKEIYVTDASDYVTPGSLYCYDKNGKKKWQVVTGDIPAHMAFVY